MNHILKQVRRYFDKMYCGKRIFVLPYTVSDFYSGSTEEKTSNYRNFSKTRLGTKMFLFHKYNTEEKLNSCSCSNKRSWKWELANYELESTERLR